MHNCKEFDAMANAVLTESIEAQNQGPGPRSRGVRLGPRAFSASVVDSLSDGFVFLLSGRKLYSAYLWTVLHLTRKYASIK